MAKKIVVSVALLLGCSLCSRAQMMPQEQGSFLPDTLVEIQQLDTTIRLDIRYATTNNFSGQAVYAEPRAFLQKAAAQALLSAHRALRRQGYGIIVYDAYRPWSVTKLFWDITKPEHREFVADPAQGSRHNRGCAVDVTLYDLATGEAVEMTGDYDEWSERSYPHYNGGTKKQRRLRDLLRKHMEAAGFTVYPTEWWHFDYKGWQQYRIQNKSFAELTR